MVLEDNTGMADFHTSLLDAVNVRITTRMYEDEKIDSDLSRQLRQNIDAVNLISGLHMQLIENCPQVFARANAEGHFRNAQNFIALIGPADSDEAREAAGYYGERLVLSAVLMGLQTGWVAGSWDKDEAERCCDISDNEELYLGIIIGYQEGYSALMEEPYEQRCEPSGPTGHRKALMNCSLSRLPRLLQALIPPVLPILLPSLPSGLWMV